MSRRLAMAAWCVTTFGLSVLTASADDGSLFRYEAAPLVGPKLYLLSRS